MKKIGIFIFVILSISCDKEKEVVTNDTFEVVTAGIGIDCRLVLIDFKKSDQDRLMKITKSNDLRYQAFNLDKGNFSDQGLVLNIKVRKTIDSELFACTTLGIAYPWVTVLEAKLKQ